jgi:hypothetical protein
VRKIAAVAALLVLVAPACASADRPEGVVERWLISLNQGAAGDPGAYARARVSDLLLPGWEELEPGELDLIEVGRGRTWAFLAGDERYVVPFLIEHVGPGRLRASAILSDDTGSWRVEALSLGTFGLELPSEAGPGLDRGIGAAWIVAVGVAALLITLSMALMRLVRPRAQTGSSR